MSSNEHNPTDWTDENITDSPTYVTSGGMTLFTIVILFSVVMFMVLSYLYDRWYLPRYRSHNIRHSLNLRHAMVFFATNPSHIASSRGLNPAVVKSLPVFTFSDVTHKDHPFDCAVCLSEFEEGESGRVLPGCKHAFHVECIDMWFHSHSTCPLCRSLVEPLAESVTMVEEPIVIAIPSEPVSATEPRSRSGSVSSAMPLEDLGREPAPSGTPRRSFSELPVSHSFTSPMMNRMLSFTRMLSRKGRSAPSSVAGAPSQSPSSSCRIVLNESDIERGGEEIK